MAEDDLNQLVSELNQQARPTISSAGSRVLEDWLRQVRAASGSDLLLVGGVPPMIKTSGRLVRASEDVLDGDDIEAAVLPLVPAAAQSRYRAGEAVDFAFKLTGMGRFRVNLHRERGRAAVAIRALPTRLPRVTDLGFTHDISLLARLPRGLVLVAGLRVLERPRLWPRSLLTSTRGSNGMSSRSRIRLSTNTLMRPAWSSRSKSDWMRLTSRRRSGRRCARRLT